MHFDSHHEHNARGKVGGRLKDIFLAIHFLLRTEYEVFSIFIREHFTLHGLIENACHFIVKSPAQHTVYI